MGLVCVVGRRGRLFLAVDQRLELVGRSGVEEMSPPNAESVNAEYKDVGVTSRELSMGGDIVRGGDRVRRRDRSSTRSRDFRRDRLVLAMRFDRPSLSSEGIGDAVCDII